MENIKYYYESSIELFSFDSITFIEKGTDYGGLRINIFVDVLHHKTLSGKEAETFLDDYRKWLENKAMVEKK